METLVAQLVSTIQSNGGSMPFQALVESVEYKDRQKVPNALRIAKQQGLLKRTLTAVEGQPPTHTVDYIGAP